ncbi:AAA family ATPase [Ramlibacter sp.]|uniref:AAA family ATPase n=1 Tax=Ramlibacter sp. TaxID=1917967 RepID=UPI003D1164B9
MNSALKLSIRRFAQIDAAEIDFGAEGDLTILVGHQATGKSLILQWLKLVTDPISVRSDWEKFGSNWKTRDELRPLDLFFGEGMGKGYVPGTTSIRFNGKEVNLRTIFNRASGRRSGEEEEPVESTYFIPAHRALLLTDGWPRNFQQHVPGTPYVARAQSERLARWLSDAESKIFPIANRLPKELRDLFDEAIFHSATLDVDRSSPQSRLILKAGQSSSIPYMAWTAGQREFVPLLIALYELMPSGGNPRLQKQGVANIRTVILEEPELGLHPKALFAVGIGILHLLARGYRVVVSSHSPLMVDFAWAINRLRVARSREKAGTRQMLDAFELRSTAPNKELVSRLSATKARTYYLAYSGSSGSSKSVKAKDISSLQTYSSDPDKSSWGELLKYSSSLAEVIGQLDLDFSQLSEEDLVR